MDHSQYRQFKIRTKSTADDQFMMAETLTRRLRHPDWPLADLILVDGGKPQVAAVDTNIPLIGLAKKEESIVLKVDHRWHQINLPKNSHALLLLQNLRNEAHRFANRYRKKLIKKTIS
jgi:excinuclease ABC subunit C